MPEADTDKNLVAAEEGALSGDHIGGPKWTTDSSTGLTSEQVVKSRELNGDNVIPVHSTPTWMLFVRQFIGFMPILIEVAMVVSFALGDWQDGVILVALLLINACLGFRDEYHAKKSLEELSSSLESEVTVVRDGKSKAMPVSELVAGDIVMLVGGNMVPADVKWIRGDTMSIDTAAMTGEPIPRKYPGEHGDVMLSGTTVKQGECYGQCMAVGTATEMGRAQADVMADKQVTVVSVFQTKINTVVQCTVSYALVLVIAALLVQGIARGDFASGNWREAVLAALSIMVAAIPIALPLVIQINMALGAAFLANEHNAIVTSLPALQDIASMSILCSDKTGTLTTAQMSIMTESIYAMDGVNPNDILLYAYLASNADKKDDPIDRAIVSAFDKSSKAKELLTKGGYKQTALVGFNPEVKRVVAFVDGNGVKKTIAKGIVAKCIDTTAGGVDSHEIQWKVEQAGDKKFQELVKQKDQSLSKAGYKTIAISYCEGDARTDADVKWQFMGLLPMLDPPRHDTAATIRSLHHANISVKMITGDHTNVGRETARLIGLGTNILPGEDIRKSRSEQIKNELIWEADGFASVLPSDKREVVMTLRNEYGVVCGMTGDGVNDAPALSAAQVGIAVQGATDAAKNAADLILTEAGLSPIYGAVLEARRIFARIKSYVVYRIAASLILATTLSVVIYVSGCVIDTLMVIILAFLNDVSMIPVAYDNADATAKPQMARASKLVAMSVYYAIFHTGFALIFYYEIGNNKLEGFDTNTCAPGVQGFIWLHLFIATELMIFSARAPSFFWKSMPSWKLVLSVFITIAVGILIAIFSDRFGVPGKCVGWIVLANVIIFVLLDVGKVGVRELIKDSPGEVIKGDALIEEKVVPENESTQALKKQMRYEVHRSSVVPPSERGVSFQVKDTSSFVGKLVNASFTDGFIQKRNIVTNVRHHPTSMGF